MKLLQRRLLVFLNVLYRPRLIAHGFIPVRGRGIRSNASEHVDRRWLLNIDLEDFFTTIHFGRVRGLFASYGIQLPAADLLARICCYNSVLPQGAPTSPAVSNLVCRRLDLALQRFASAHGCRVTRYADDITFSTMRQAFDPAVASIDYSDGQRVVTLGAPLRHLIQSNSFRINETKTRARGQSDRQDVTGLTVNKTVNVRRSYVRSVRGMLYAAERHGLAEAQAYFESKYSRTRHPNLPPPEFLRSLEGRLAFLAQIKGTHNPVVTALWNRACRLDDRLTPRVGTLHEVVHALWVIEYESLGEKDTVIKGHGTAFALEGWGLVTAAHCIGVRVRLYHAGSPNVTFPAIIKQLNHERDLCLLEIPADTRTAIMIAGDSRQLAPGERVSFAGFPETPATPSFLDGTVTSIPHRGGFRYIVPSFVTHKGASGGPLLDCSLRVVGVTLFGPNALQEEGSNAVRSAAIEIAEVQNTTAFNGTNPDLLTA